MTRCHRCDDRVTPATAQVWIPPADEPTHGFVMHERCARDIRGDRRYAPKVLPRETRAPIQFPEGSA